MLPGDSQPETSSWFIFKCQTISYGGLQVSVAAENANGTAHLRTKDEGIAGARQSVAGGHSHPALATPTPPLLPLGVGLCADLI